MNALRHVRPGGGFVPAFPMFKRVHVSGSKAIPLFKWVLEQCPIAPQITFSERRNLRYEPISAEDIRWNFEKILIDQDGTPVTRFAHQVKPVELEPHIDSLLKENK